MVRGYIMSDLPNIEDIDLKGFTDADFKILSTVRGWCYKILPLVYDDSISYYETLAKVTETLNDLVKNNNIIPEYMMKLILEYINSGTIGTIVQEILATYILNVKYPPDGITPAVGDGSADDHDAIQGCIDYASNHGGGAIYFPTGTYFTSPFSIPSNVSLYGFDRYKSKIMLKPQDSNEYLLKIVGVNHQIHNLGFDGNCNNQTQEVPAITTESGVSNLLSTNLIIQNASTALNLTGVQAHSQFSDIVLADYRKSALLITGGTGIQMDNIYFTSSFTNVTDCVSIKNGNTHIIKGIYNNIQPFLTKIVKLKSCINCNIEIDCTSGAVQDFTYEDNNPDNNIRIGLIEKFVRNDISSKIKNINLTVNGDFTEHTETRTNIYTKLDETVEDKTEEILNTEVKTVTGDSNEIYTSNKTIDVAGNRTVSVNGDETYTVNGNVDEHYNGDYHANFKNTPELHSETDHFIISSPKRSIDVLNLSNDMSNLLYLTNEGTQKHQSVEARYGQGFARSNDTIMVCLRDSEESTCDVLFYTLDGILKNKVTRSDLGHANGADYGWDMFWITSWKLDGSWNGLIKLSTDGSERGVASVSGLVSNDSLVAITIDRVNGKMYGRGRWWDVYEMTPNSNSDPSSFTAVRIAGAPNVNFSYTAQGMAYYNNMLFYPISEPSGVIITDLTGNVLSSYNTYPFAGLFRVKELEDMQIDEETGMAHFFSTFNLPDAARPTAILQFSRYNLVKPECVDLDNVDTYNDHPTLNVDNSQFYFVRGTKEHPFYDLWEAVFASYALQAIGQRGVTINVTKTDAPYVCGSIRGNAIAILNGNNALVDAFSLRGAAGQFSSLQVQNGITKNSFFVIDNFHGTINSIHAVPTTHTQTILFNCTHSLCYIRDVSETTFNYNVRAAYSIIGCYDTVGYYLPNSAPVTLINGIDCGSVSCTTGGKKYTSFDKCHCENNTGWNRFTEYIIGHDSIRYPMSGSGTITLKDGTTVTLTVANDGLTFKSSKDVDVRLYLR